MDTYISENVLVSEDQSGRMNYCAICQQSSKLKTDIERHIESAHIETDPFKCEVCGSSVKTRRSLKIHMKQHN